MFSNFAVEEVDFEHGATLINDCRYLFLRSIGEVQELTLGIVLEEAKIQATVPHIAANDDPIERLKSEGRPIESDATCRVFELLFDDSHLVSYHLLNETFSRYPAEPENFKGKLLRKFSWSHLLEFIKRTTNASDAFPGILEHYQIATLNHIVDVISTGPPRIAVGFRHGTNVPLRIC